MVKKVVEFVTFGIWQKKDSEYKSKHIRWAVRQVKVLIYMVKGAGDHNIVVRSAALTFYTLMSIVPIAAMIFGIVKGFGVETTFSEYLHNEFPQYNDLINQITDFANNLLARTKGGIIAATGFVVLVWSIMKVFGNIESAFNTIWEIKKSRSLTRKFSDYMAVMFVAPILWIISNGITLSIQSELSHYSGSIFLDILYGIASLLSMWIMFALIYRIMPNTKVKMRSAINAGIIAGTIFQIFQVGYVFLQSQMTSYNAIYGSFAALPLFLIWLQSSWQILLFGAELSFTYQNMSKYEQERQSMHMSYDHRQKILVAVMLVSIRRFIVNEPPITAETAAQQLNLPIRIVSDVIFDLENASLISAIQNSEDDKIFAYIPARDIHKITVRDVIDSVEQKGIENFEFQNNKELNKISSLLDSARGEASKSDKNILLMEL